VGEELVDIMDNSDLAHYSLVLLPLSGAQLVEAEFVGGAGDNLELGVDAAVGIQAALVAASDDVGNFGIADDFIQLGQVDDHVRVAASDNSVGLGIGVRQG